MIMVVTTNPTDDLIRLAAWQSRLRLQQIELKDLVENFAKPVFDEFSTFVYAHYKVIKEEYKDRYIAPWIFNKVGVHLTACDFEPTSDGGLKAAFQHGDGEYASGIVLPPEYILMETEARNAYVRQLMLAELDEEAERVARCKAVQLEAARELLRKNGEPV